MDALAYNYSSAFAPKATRLVRALLLQPERKWGVVELAKTVDVSAGHATNTLKLLGRAGYTASTQEGIALLKPGALLSGWASLRRFGVDDSLRHYVVMGDATQAEAKFVQAAEKLNCRYALTLFAGARHRAPFVRYPSVHAYVEGNQDLLVRETGARPVSEGGNLVLVEPVDAGVFFGTQDVGGVRVVSDVQLYVDLYDFPTRGREQAEYLLEKVLPGMRGSDAPEVQALYHESQETRRQADDAFKNSDFTDAFRLYGIHLDQLEKVGTIEAQRDSGRSHLLEWMSLVHAAFEEKDRKYLDLARKRWTTDAEVEEVREAVGYSKAYVERALVAYYLAMLQHAQTEQERERYAAKAKTHASIATGRYMESRSELVEDVRRMMSSARSGKV